MTDTLKKARVRKPRPPAPPPLAERINDASGAMLEATFEKLRKRQKTMRLKPQRVVMPVWVVTPDEGAESPVLREEHAITPGTLYYDYVVSVFELKDEFLKDEAFRRPEVWLGHFDLHERQVNDAV